VRVDSVALLKKRFGLGGDTFVEIRPGKGLPMSTDGAKIVSVKDTEMTDLVMAQVEEIKTEVLATLRETQSTLQVLTGLVAEVRAPGGPVMGILANVEKITGDLAEGEGASALLRDPALAGEIRGIVESVRALLGDAQKSTAKLPGLIAKVDDEAEDLFLLLRQARQTLAESQKTLEGLQRHWLLSGAMEKAGGAKPSGDALSAEELHSLEGRR
jgi:ABC-type transporter Mla subunit MlaD